MAWSFKIARIAGTEVRIHFTFLLLLAWIGIATAANSGASAGLTGILFLLLVFLCVLLHEFGHVFAALRYGITTPKITLLPFGGVASMSRIPKQPLHELVVAVAGPMVNVLIAGVLILVRKGVPEWSDAGGIPGGGSLLDGLIWVNVILVLFNMIPAFPMDGGRAFRALLSFVVSREKATSVAAFLGQMLAVVGAVLALSWGQPILLLVAIFVFFAAGSEASMVETEHILEGVNARGAAMSEFHTLRLNDTIQHAVDLMLNGSQADFPVVNDQGQCIGIATRNEIIRGLRDEGPDHRVADALETIPSQIDGEVSAVEAWQKLARSGLPAVAVVDDKGRLTHWLTRENLSEVILTRSAIEGAEWLRQKGTREIVDDNENA